MAGDAAAAGVTFRDVLANREFRAMYVAQALSVLGDQLARIAVAVLVFRQSDSALLTAISFAVSYLPWVVGGPLLSGYADRLPRRSVMVVCDLARAALVLAVATPHAPTWLLLVLVTLVALLEPPFAAARSSMLPDVVGEGDRYTRAATLANTTNNLAVVIGFAIGGALVAGIGPRWSIVADCATFALSGWLVARYVQWRPAAAAGRRRMLHDLREGTSIVFGDAYLRWLVVVSWIIVAADITTESVAVPYAADHGGGATTAGLLTAALPMGVVIGAAYLATGARVRRASALMAPMALGAPLVLAITAFDPPVVVAAALWFVGGFLSAMQVIANSRFVAAVPREVRGRAFGVAAAGIAVAQGVGALVCGALAQQFGAAAGIAMVVLPCFALVCLLTARPHRSSNQPDPSITAETPCIIADQNEPAPMPSTTTATPLRTPARVWVLTLGLLAIAGLAFPLLAHQRELVPARVPGGWLFALFFVAMVYPVEFVFRRQPLSIHLETVPLVLGLFFLPPLELVTVQLAAATLRSLVRRHPPVQLLFNLGLTATYTLSSIEVFRHLTPRPASVHVASWPATFAAVLVNEAVTILLLVLVLYLSDRTPARHTAGPLALGAAAALGSTFLALPTAAAVAFDTSTAWAITVFVVITIGGVRMYHRLAARHAALDRLYAVARELGPVAADPTDLAPALAQLRRILRAETLELTTAASEPGFQNVVSVFEHERGEGIRVLDREESSTPEEAARRRPSWRRRSNAAATISAVVRGDRDLGVLTARTRLGQGDGFDAADRRLLEAAAGQLAAALEKGRLVDSLRRAATRDSLTNLANLDSLRDFLATMLADGGSGVLLLLDIDRFHEINDTLGHDAGDMILLEVARRLESAPTAGALVARVGGDQFALAIPGQAGGEVARLAALAVKSRVDGPLRFESVSADLRVTIGMARSPEHGDDAATLLRRAEMAMAAAKGSSSGIGEWEPTYERDGSRRLQLLAGLRVALGSDELRVEFQPKIKLGSGEVAGFEALVRWKHPELGNISPAEFVPLAEASGLVSALTSHVLRMSLEAVRRWQDAGRQVGVAVNISARSLDDPVLVGQVAAMLTASGVEPRWLTLEITESSVMENPTRAIDVLLQLRSLGVRLSIDDFGTGYSSLHQLRGLPVHEVKIDKAFVDEVDGGGADRAVVRAIVELCDSLGLLTVAEGVERASQAYALESLGVGQVQGYFYGRPMRESAATDWLLPRQIAAQQPERRRS